MLADRVVLMTGAGRGLGRVMVLALLNEGARVVLSSTDAQSLTSTIAEAGVSRDRAVAIPANLAEPNEVERLAAEAEAAFGQIDVLVNNAGVGTDAIRVNYRSNPFRFWEVGPETFDLFFKINSTAAYRLAALLAPRMIGRGWGRIINNTTSLDTMLRIPVYGGSKAALEAHTAIMARDLEGTGVTANVLIPGGAAVTRMTENFDVSIEMLIPADVMAKPIVYLASDASNAVTGRRFIANKWDSGLPVDQAAVLASDSVAWTGYGTPGVQPSSESEGLSD
ncbi:MAG: family oxidoreductase [Bradyrhizobium sp.]|nr:family oxidoreductase [Bradyrhizobium sp.]